MLAPRGGIGASRSASLDRQCPEIISESRGRRDSRLVGGSTALRFARSPYAGGLVRPADPPNPHRATPRVGRANIALKGLWHEPCDPRFLRRPSVRRNGGGSFQ